MTEFGITNGTARHFDGFDPDAWRRELEEGSEADSDRAEDPKHGLEFDSDLRLDTRSNDVIKGLLARGNLAVVFGPSGCGKTFVILAMLYAMALARSFFGKRTQQVSALYVGLEGAHGLRRRFIAAASEYGSAASSLGYAAGIPR